MELSRMRTGRRRSRFLNKAGHGSLGIVRKMEEPARVLVTGASGYIASHLIKSLPTDGVYRVRGTEVTSPKPQLSYLLQDCALLKVDICIFQLQVYNISPIRVLRIIKNRFVVLTVFIILLVATEDIHVAHFLHNFFRLALSSLLSSRHDYGLVCACVTKKN